MAMIRIYEGKNLDEIKKTAVEEFSKQEEELVFDLIEEGGRGVFGFLGSKKIKVKVTEKTKDELAVKAKDVLDNILKYFDIPYVIEVKERDQSIFLNIVSPNTGIIIGKGGNTLQSLQHIVSKIVGTERDDSEDDKRIIIDIEGYLDKKKDGIVDLAKKSSVKAEKTNRPVILPNMSSFDRWVVHNTLSENQNVYTKSVGEGRDRLLIIIPQALRDREDEIVRKYSNGRSHGEF
jgi:spoIIIJ-associated protein